MTNKTNSAIYNEVKAQADVARSVLFRAYDQFSTTVPPRSIINDIVSTAQIILGDPDPGIKFNEFMRLKDQLEFSSLSRLSLLNETTSEYHKDQAISESYRDCLAVDAFARSVGFPGILCQRISTRE